MSTYVEHMEFFNRSESEQSVIVNEVMDHVYQHWQHLLTRLHPNIFSITRANILANAVSQFTGMFRFQLILLLCN